MHVPFGVAYGRMIDQPNSAEDAPSTRFVRRKCRHRKYRYDPFANLDAFPTRCYYDETGEMMDTCRGQ